MKKSYLYTVKNIICEYNDENKVENFSGFSSEIFSRRGTSLIVLGNLRQYS